MLIEGLHYLTTPVPRAQRTLGYLRESVLLMSRSRRCRAAWADHLDAARSAIRQSCADLDRRRTAVVLGSGLLDDVPLAHLAQCFERVILVDMVHLWPARWAAHRYANVALQVSDLSGCVKWLRGEGERCADPLSVFDRRDIDFVVSANCLSQLPILPLDWFESRNRPPPDELGRSIVAGHLEGLSRLQTRVCLIADTEQVTDNREGQLVERSDLLHGIVLPEPDRSWIWEIAPFGEVERHRRERHRVQAHLDWRP
ncbi:hypothetical protein [Methylobacterium bullatum]|uniref:Class I SAM-dependent methyltransferase n=1 Tax=Methylobacterium bullatum TaxID=570505 RepID=A0A679JZE4_9HYPH|nr:hypothetical protein MBLL_03008 [Methylobacterium bullatum]